MEKVIPNQQIFSSYADALKEAEKYIQSFIKKELNSYVETRECLFGKFHHNKDLHIGSIRKFKDTLNGSEIIVYMRADYEPRNNLNSIDVEIFTDKKRILTVHFKFGIEDCPSIFKQIRQGDKLEK